MSGNVVGKNKVVSITYSIKHENGDIAEQSDVAVDYIHCAEDNDMFPKIEAALEGKNIGDSVEVTLTPEEGFGPHNPNMTFTDELENVPEEYRFVGAQPSFQNENGEVVQMVVSKIEDGKLTVDANHPFAGKHMSFSVKIVAIRDATMDEIQNSRLSPPGTDTLQ